MDRRFFLRLLGFASPAMILAAHSGPARGSGIPPALHPPEIEVATVRIRGVAPYVQHAFSQTSDRHHGRDAAVYEAAMHKSRQGWCGIPGPALRNALFSACRLAGVKMMRAKLSLFVEADGFDEYDNTSLVKITKGEPHGYYSRVSTTKILCRQMWDEGWEADVRIRWDVDQFSASGVFNLFALAGLQVGIGEGRPGSHNSAGRWGLFEIVK